MEFEQSNFTFVYNENEKMSKEDEIDCNRSGLSVGFYKYKSFIFLFFLHKTHTHTQHTGFLLT
jgi:hypothetical protein